MVALWPCFHRRKHAHDLFLANLEGPAESVMRSAVCPCGLQQAFVADQQSRGLWASNAFAATVGHNRGPPLEMDVRHCQNLGGCINQYGHLMFASYIADHLRSKRTFVARP